MRPPTKKQKAGPEKTTSTRTEKTVEKAGGKTSALPKNALTRLIKGKMTKPSTAVPMASAAFPMPSSSKEHVSSIMSSCISVL